MGYGNTKFIFRQAKNHLDLLHEHIIEGIFYYKISLVQQVVFLFMILQKELHLIKYNSGLKKSNRIQAIKFSSYQLEINLI